MALLRAWSGLLARSPSHPFLPAQSSLARRRFCGLAAGFALDLAAAGPAAAQAPADAPEPERFRSFLDSLYPQAAAKGIGRESVEAIFRDLTPDPAVAAAPTRQSEFERPFSAYFNEAVVGRRIAQGRALAQQWAGEIVVISQRFGVPGPILLAAWGMESDFSRSMGAKDVIRSLATLAFRQPERALYRDELIAALVMLVKAGVPREKLTGSWAGAMGGPQFLPSVYLAHAVHYRGVGAPDIWSNGADILASIGAFFQGAGWQPARPWGMEVQVPEGFAYGALHADFRHWAGLGFRRADGAALPAAGRAALFFPEGAGGPAFLLGDNYWVIKTYNNSDAYALSFACLADRIAGGPPLHRPWPKAPTLFRHDEKVEIQRLLQKLGFYEGTVDGRFGPTSRDAIHAFQLAHHDQPADGIGRRDLLAKLRKAAGR